MKRNIFKTFLSHVVNFDISESQHVNVIPASSGFLSSEQEFNFLCALGDLCSIKQLSLKHLNLKMTRPIKDKTPDEEQQIQQQHLVCWINPTLSPLQGWGELFMENYK